MGYLGKLIERATDTNLTLENNQIGNYSITPQHGVYIAVYHIYKDNCNVIWTKSKRRYNNQHVATITIGFSKVDININKDYLRPIEIDQIINTINNLYPKFDINTTGFEE